jgi:two-component system, cell cycle sensor histidine kinase and response regulator CckA
MDSAGTADLRPEGQLAFYRALFEDSPEPMIVAEPATGSILAANDAACQLYGHDRPSLLRLTLSDLAFHPEDRDAVRAALAALPESPGSIARVDARLRHADGTWRWLDVRGRRLDPDLPTSGIVIDSRDVTDRHDHEEVLRQSAQLVQSQKMEAVGRLAGGIAHDFNNLLTAIRGYTEFLLEDLSEGAQRNDVREIQKVTERAVGLTRQLLVFGKRQITQPEVLDVNAAIADLQEMLGRLLGEDIDLALELSPGLPCVHMDRAQLEQVLMNLLLNARDAMPDGGRIVVETAHNPNGPGTADGRTSDLGYVYLIVSDTGHGIEPEALPHIFEPFFSTKGSAGTGLGLATVYAIADQAGGDVRVESRVGEGSVFRVRFPGFVGDAVPNAVDAGARPDDRSTGTVLLVEDEAHVRDVIRRSLEQRGYAVLEASNGDEAVRLAAAHPGEIHLLLTDVVLPFMSGPALADLIQASRPATPVLYMSGYTEDAAAIQRISGPDAPFLAKPFSPDSVFAKVAETIRAGGGP